MGAVVRLRIPLALGALAVAALGCASTPDGGVTHVVRPGENVYRISRYYGVPMRDVLRANRIRDVTEIPIGARLWIPGARRSAPESNLASHPGPAAIAPSGPPVGARQTDLSFRWPVRGRVSSGFGWRKGGVHEGLDIPAPSGTPIRAAESGRVIHSGGGLGAYGRVVIVKHTGRFSTVYAHNRVNLVRKGEFVEKGQVIAEVGRTGNASGSHVHFEIRRDRRPIDPRMYLP